MSCWLSRCSIAGLEQVFDGFAATRVSLRLGPSSSCFHDAMILMFCFPVRVKGELRGLLCARMPNDVMSDLIQREAGHTYPDSGDNYLFMVESRFDPRIAPGTALSRSRFEVSRGGGDQAYAAAALHPWPPPYNGSLCVEKGSKAHAVTPLRPRGRTQPGGPAAAVRRYR